MTEPSAGDLAFRYVESSALLAALIERDTNALTSLEADGRHVTSALTLAEATRAILRARLAGRLSPEQERDAAAKLRRFEARYDVIPMSRQILERAGRPFPVEPVRTLDAIHLATIEAIGEAPPLVTVLTRDARVRDNAAALGYAIE